MTRKGGKRPPPRVHEGERFVAGERAAGRGADEASAGDEPGAGGSRDGSAGVEGSPEHAPEGAREHEDAAPEQVTEEPREHEDAAPEQASEAASGEPPAGGEDEAHEHVAGETGSEDHVPGDSPPAAEPAEADMSAEPGPGGLTAADEAPADAALAEPTPGAPEDALEEELAPAPRAVPGVVLSDELPIDPDDDLRGVEGEASPRLVSILESLLFSAAKPMSVKDLRKVLQETSQHQIKLGLSNLMAATKSRGVVLAQVAGGFQFRTHPDNAIWVQKMLQAKPAKLSRTQIETLAIIAYRQPITRPEIDDIRGVDSGAVLKSLLEREMIQIVGKKEEPGRPLLYGTTVRFLEFFNLRSLRDLPTLRDFRDLSEESKATLRERLGDLQVAEALGQEVLGFPEGQGETAMAAGPGEAGAAESAAEEAAAAEGVAEAVVAEAADEPAEVAETEPGGLADQAEAPAEEAAPGVMEPEPEPVPAPEDEVDGAAGLVAHDELPRDALPIDGVDPVVLPVDMTEEPPQIVSGGGAAQDDVAPEVVAPEEPPPSLEDPIAGDPIAADAIAEAIVVSSGEVVEAVAPAPEEFVAELAALVHTAEVPPPEDEERPETAVDAEDRLSAADERPDDEVADAPDERPGSEVADADDERPDEAADAPEQLRDGVDAGEGSPSADDEPADGETVSGQTDDRETPVGEPDVSEPVEPGVSRDGQDGAAGPSPGESAGDAEPAAGEPPLAREGEEPQDAALIEPPANERDSTE